MLPDYPKLKEELATVLVQWFKGRVDHHMGRLHEVPRVRIFEGSKRRLTRATGETEPGEFREVDSEFQLSWEEIPGLDLKLLLKKLDESASKMADTLAIDMYETISKAAASGGNVVDGKGRPLSPEIILDALSTVYVEFRRDGSPRMPDLHIHPNLAEAAARTAKELETDPGLKMKYQSIMQTKREEWIAREASRKLVG